MLSYSSKVHRIVGPQIVRVRDTWQLTHRRTRRRGARRPQCRTTAYARA